MDRFSIAIFAVMIIGGGLLLAMLVSMAYDIEKREYNGLQTESCYGLSLKFDWGKEWYHFMRFFPIADDAKKLYDSRGCDL